MARWIRAPVTKKATWLPPPGTCNSQKLPSDYHIHAMACGRPHTYAKSKVKWFFFKMTISLPLNIHPKVGLKGCTVILILLCFLRRLHISHNGFKVIPISGVLSLSILINHVSLWVSVAFPSFPFSLSEGVLGIEPRRTRIGRYSYLSTVAPLWAERLPKEGGLSSMQSSREQDGFGNSEIYSQRSVDFLFSCFQNIWGSFRTPCPSPALSPPRSPPTHITGALIDIQGTLSRAKSVWIGFQSFTRSPHVKPSSALVEPSDDSWATCLP